MWKYLLSNPANLSLNSKEAAKRKQKLTACNSNDKAVINQGGEWKLNNHALELTVNLCKSLGNFKNLQTGCIPAEPKINYDSFLEYLNDSMKNITSLTGEAWSRKGSKAQKADLLKSKKSAEDILLPSDKKYKKMKGTAGAHCSINNKDVSETIKKMNQKLKSSISWINSYSTTPMAKFRYEYGASEPNVITINRSKSRSNNSKSKSRAEKSKPHCKKGSAVRKVKNERSVEQTKESRNISIHSNKANSKILCNKIKSDLKEGSNKLSKYLRSWKEREKKGKISKADQSTTKQQANKFDILFGTRAGSVDYQKQLLKYEESNRLLYSCHLNQTSSLSNLKQNKNKDTSFRNNSKNKSQNSIKSNNRSTDKSHKGIK